MKAQSSAGKIVPKDRRDCKSEWTGMPVQAALHQSGASTGRQTKEAQNEPFCWNRDGPALRHTNRPATDSNNFPNRQGKGSG